MITMVTPKSSTEASRLKGLHPNTEMLFYPVRNSRRIKKNKKNKSNSTADKKESEINQFVNWTTDIVKVTKKHVVKKFI